MFIPLSLAGVVFISVSILLFAVEFNILNDAISPEWIPRIELSKAKCAVGKPLP